MPQPENGSSWRCRATGPLGKGSYKTVTMFFATASRVRLEEQCGTPGARGFTEGPGPPSATPYASWAPRNWADTSGAALAGSQPGKKPQKRKMNSAQTPSKPASLRRAAVPSAGLPWAQ